MSPLLAKLQWIWGLVLIIVIINAPLQNANAPKRIWNLKRRIWKWTTQLSLILTTTYFAEMGLHTQKVECGQNRKKPAEPLQHIVTGVMRSATATNTLLICCKTKKNIHLTKRMVRIKCAMSECDRGTRWMWKSESVGEFVERQENNRRHEKKKNK